MDFSGGTARLRMECPRRLSIPRILLLLVTIGGGTARMEAAIGLTLTADPAGPAPVGTMIRWTARVSPPPLDELWYRFRVRESGDSARMIRDFGPANTLDWTALDEGTYRIEVSVQNRRSLEVSTSFSFFRLESRVAGDQPVISPTTHPLVFLFSGPPCEQGRARVRFESAQGAVQYTPYKPCAGGRSLNFYLAGLAPAQEYSASLVVERGRESSAGPAVSFAIGDVSYVLAGPSVVRAAAVPASEGILLQAPLFLPALATDLDGNLLWFGPPDVSYLTRPEPDGTFFGLIQSRTNPAKDAVRRFDLVGMTVQETNAARVSEQLAALGKRPITGFHHEAKSLSQGRSLVLGGVEEILTDVQGAGPVDVIGDMILVLDADLQVLWAWDTFDHLDTSRRAVLGETCLANPGCAAYYLAADANDWTHGNSVEESPDGSLLFSIRHQDWVIKIDYQNGAGNGEVIWRLGKDGDFTYDSADPYPWFSHQHDASYEPGSRSTITLFDNGNTRVLLTPGASRGQAIELDEENGTARLVLNADLGLFSFALGSAQRLLGGNYHFDAGYVLTPPSSPGPVAFSLQVDSAGEVVSSLEWRTPVYRSFRLSDLYGPADAPARPPVRLMPFRD